MYPLKFKKYLVEKVWGGHKFRDNLNFDIKDDKLYGESWEVSTRENGMSYIENGKYKGRSLLEVLEDNPRILGDEVTRDFKGKFPLLIKFLDINDKLSVQVHPSDEYALKIEGDFGKSESWYVVDASEDAKLIMGINPNITKEEFLEKVRKGDFENLFNQIKVKKGDFINIKPGTVHATLEGSILICEIQQNSDVTYRIYDFGRIVNGSLRELHIDKAIDVIDFSVQPEISSTTSREKIYLQGAVKENLVKGKYFNIDRLLIEKEHEDKIHKNFKIYSIIEGEGEILSNGISYPCKKGDSYLIPANFLVKIIGNLEIIKSFL